MKTIALRFGEHFAPECGTISAHQEIIDKLGYVWYGKMGTVVSNKVIAEILKIKEKRILLIRSGKAERYWAYIEDIKTEKPDVKGIPAYYRNNTDKFKTWFKVIRIELAERGVMGKCLVASSGQPLGEVSKHSMSPYFIIEVEE